LALDISLKKETENCKLAEHDLLDNNHCIHINKTYAENVRRSKTLP
jgi:hypothetical protein